MLGLLQPPQMLTAPPRRGMQPAPGRARRGAAAAAVRLPGVFQPRQGRRRWVGPAGAHAGLHAAWARATCGCDQRPAQAACPCTACTHLVVHECEPASCSICMRLPPGTPGAHQIRRGVCGAGLQTGAQPARSGDAADARQLLGKGRHARRSCPAAPRGMHVRDSAGAAHRQCRCFVYLQRSASLRDLPR